MRPARERISRIDRPHKWTAQSAWRCALIRPPLNRRVLELVVVGSLLTMFATEFLTKLWASHQAAEGENTAIAGAILGGL